MLAGPIRQLVRELQRLPGVGEKTAFRLALHLLTAPEEQSRSLASALVEVKTRIAPCKVCHQLTEEQPCAICSSPRRDQSLLCVVEDQASLMAIERSKTFGGVYHVLWGRISPMDGIGPEKLMIGDLHERVCAGGIKEVVLATNSNVEGETTALYLKKQLEASNVRITRIARGIPVGGDIEYVDSLTIGRALDGRSSY